MMLGVQLIGTAFGLFMAYLTYLYYKRKNYSLNDLLIWMAIWAGFLYATIFPESLEGLVKPLMFYRLLDLLMAASFMVLFTLMFMIYSTSKKNEQKINKMVREIALMHDPKKSLKE